MPGFIFKCPKCRMDVQIAEAVAKPGARVKCPNCGSTAPVPADVIAAAEEDRTRVEEKRRAKEARKADRARRKAEKRLEKTKLEEERSEQRQAARQEWAKEWRAAQEKEGKVAAQQAHQEPEPTRQEPVTMERALALQKSYVGAAAITFVLYCFFWLPGLIVNCLYLADAARIAKIAGRTTTGVGCLWFMLFLGFLPLAFFLLVIVVPGCNMLLGA